jgi:hypothetical protein
MIDNDSVGQLEMRSLAHRLQAYAAELGSDPKRQFDLRMAAELMEHLARLTTKLARPAEVPLHSGGACSKPTQRPSGGGLLAGQAGRWPD